MEETKKRILNLLAANMPGSAAIVLSNATDKLTEGEFRELNDKINKFPVKVRCKPSYVVNMRRRRRGNRWGNGHL